jgi:hypothetical protein
MNNRRNAMLFLAITLVILIASCRGADDIVDDLGEGAELRSDSEFATDQAVAAATSKVAETEAARPTSTPTPNPAWQYFRDASGDEIICGGGSTQDGVVDIRPITFKHSNFAIDVIEIGMGKAPRNAFSYAVVIFLKSDRQPLRAFIYEVHDGVMKIGEIDPSTFELITPIESVEGFDIYLDGNLVIFDFPDDFFPDGMNEFFAQSFHKYRDVLPTKCDEAEGILRAILP